MEVSKAWYNEINMRGLLSGNSFRWSEASLFIGGYRMTFGESLQSLLATSGLKSRHLAMTLGYDVSYISRWPNDIKLPSIRTNDRLFQDIAAFFVANSDPDARAEMVQKLQLPCRNPQDDEALSQAILQLLQTSYIRQADPKAHLTGAFQQNAVFLSGESIWETPCSGIPVLPAGRCPSCGDHYHHTHLSVLSPQRHVFSKPGRRCAAACPHLAVSVSGVYSGPPQRVFPVPSLSAVRPPSGGVPVLRAKGAAGEQQPLPDSG